MPKLPTAPAVQIGDAVVGGGRRASAQDFGAPGLGDAGMVGAGHQIQNAAQAQLNYMEESEARKALVSSTQVRAQYARKLDEAALSGGDLGKLKEEMANDLAKIGEGFQTRKGQEQLELYTANSAIMYDQQAATIQVQRARSEAKIQGHQFLVSASALIQSNPGYLAVAEANADALAATFTKVPSNIRAEIADGLKKDLNMAAAVSASRMDPEGTKKRLDAGEWDLTPEQRNIAINKADTEIRAKRADESYHREEERRQKIERNDAARDMHFKSIIDGGFTRRKVMDDPNLLPATREHLITFAEARAKEFAGRESKSDANTKRELFMAATAPEGDPRRIYNADKIFQAVDTGKLNTTDANWLNGIVAAQKDENGRSFSAASNQRLRVVERAMLADPVIKNTPGLMDEVSLSLISKLESAAKAKRNANESPMTLLDPDHKDYFFKPGLLKSTADDVRAQQVANVTASAPRVSSPEQALLIPDGQYFTDDSGTPKQMTAAIRRKLEGAKTVFPVVPSGETPFAQERRTAEQRGRRYNDWAGNN